MRHRLISQYRSAAVNKRSRWRGRERHAIKALCTARCARRSLRCATFVNARQGTISQTLNCVRLRCSSAHPLPLHATSQIMDNAVQWPRRSLCHPRYVVAWRCGKREWSGDDSGCELCDASGVIRHYLKETTSWSIQRCQQSDATSPYLIIPTGEQSAMRRLHLSRCDAISHDWLGRSAGGVRRARGAAVHRAAPRGFGWRHSRLIWSRRASRLPIARAAFCCRCDDWRALLFGRWIREPSLARGIRDCTVICQRRCAWRWFRRWRHLTNSVRFNGASG